MPFASQRSRISADAPPRAAPSGWVVAVASAPGRPASECGCLCRDDRGPRARRPRRPRLVILGYSQLAAQDVRVGRNRADRLVRGAFLFGMSRRQQSVTTRRHASGDRAPDLVQAAIPDHRAESCGRRHHLCPHHAAIVQWRSCSTTRMRKLLRHVRVRVVRSASLRRFVTRAKARSPYPTTSNRGTNLCRRHSTLFGPARMRHAHWYRRDHDSHQVYGTDANPGSASWPTKWRMARREDE